MKPIDRTAFVAMKPSTVAAERDQITEREIDVIPHNWAILSHPLTRVVLTLLTRVVLTWGLIPPADAGGTDLADAGGTDLGTYSTC
jgi:hypothetical protein